MTLWESLDLDLAIVQAPMAGVQDATLAVASTAGGLGSLPCVMLTPDVDARARGVLLGFLRFVDRTRCPLCVSAEIRGRQAALLQPSRASTHEEGAQ